MQAETLTQLIDLASRQAGSDYKLAKLLHCSRGYVSDWRHGRKKCPVADVVLMAELAGLVPEQWAARAIIAEYEGKPKGEKLAEALKKALPATGAVVALFGHSAGVAAERFIRCILCESVAFRRQFSLTWVPPIPGTLQKG